MPCYKLRCAKCEQEEEVVCHHSELKAMRCQNPKCTEEALYVVPVRSTFTGNFT